MAEHPLSCEEVLALKKMMAPRLWPWSARGTVPHALRPYIGCTHFKSGQPLPDVLRAAVAPSSSAMHFFKDSIYILRLAMFSLGYLFNFLVNVLVGACIFVLPWSLLGWIVFLTSMLVFGFGDCPASSGMRSGLLLAWLVCVPLLAGVSVLMCWAWSRSRFTVPMLGDCGMARPLEDVLYMLYILDHCHSATQSFPVHTFKLGYTRYTVFSDGSHTVEIKGDDADQK